MMESVEATERDSAPLELTVSGTAAGAAVMVMTSGIELTRACTVATAVWPWPSLMVTVSAQDCCAPVALVGAVQDGFCMVAAGTNVPLFGRPWHVALHA